jgi:hypothetical protein
VAERPVLLQVQEQEPMQPGRVPESLQARVLEPCPQQELADSLGLEPVLVVRLLRRSLALLESSSCIRQRTKQPTN